MVERLRLATGTMYQQLAERDANVVGTDACPDEQRRQQDRTVLAVAGTREQRLVREQPGIATVLAIGDVLANPARNHVGSEVEAAARSSRETLQVVARRSDLLVEAAAQYSIVLGNEE